MLDLLWFRRLLYLTQHLTGVGGGPADLVLIALLAPDALASESQLQLLSTALLATRLLLDGFLRHVERATHPSRPIRRLG